MEVYMSMVFCRGCGKEIHETAITCPNCGAPQIISTNQSGQTVSGVMTFFFGFFYFFFKGWWRPECYSFLNNLKKMIND